MGMDTTNKRWMQLFVIMAAALVIVAVAVAMLMSGGAPAQATTAHSGSGHLLPTTDATPTPTPRIPNPEPCGETGNTNTEADRVVDSGRYALFEVWWNPDELELTNNTCPPSVDYVPEGLGVRADRYASGIDIAAEPPTIIHIPSTAMVDLNTTTKYTREAYPDVWVADNAENRDADGNLTPGVGDRKVWVLPKCLSIGSLPAGELCLSFLANLLERSEWFVKGRAAERNVIEFHLDHVHQKDINRQLARYTLAYDLPRNARPAPGGFHPEWNSQNADIAVVKVTPGGYANPTWIFSSRGTYDLQVHIKGYPNTGKTNPVSRESSVTSDQRKYILHVGAEADLGVGVTVEPALEEGDETLDPGDKVTIEVTASNAAGPDTAPEAKVDVTLPEGLTYSSHEADTGTYADGVWTIGELAVTNDENSETGDDSPTLTIKATVAAETHGQDLTVKAAISATEPVRVTEENEQGEEVVKTHRVPVPDKDRENDMDAGTVTVVPLPNVDPMFRVTRSVNENSAPGTHVGDAVVAHDPDDSTLDYWLTGPESAKFDVNDQGQIFLSECGVMDYETQTSYNIKLNVSDGKNKDGNDDPPGSRIVDHNIGVLVQVNDVAGSGDDPQPPQIRLTRAQPDVSEFSSGHVVTFTAHSSYLPVCDLVYSWWGANLEDSNTGWVEQSSNGSNTFSVEREGPATWDFEARVTYVDSQGESRTISSGSETITWLGP